MLTKTSLIAGTARLTGSLNAIPCGGMSKVALPPKVSGISVPGTADEPEERIPTDTGPTVSVPVPYAFENLTRVESPPIVAKTASRIVVPAGSVLPVAPGSRPGAAHVVSQLLNPAEAGAAQSRAHSSAPTTASLE